MSPVPTTLSPKTTKPRKARLVHGTFWKTLRFYAKIKGYRAALVALLVGAAALCYILPILSLSPSGSDVMPLLRGLLEIITMSVAAFYGLLVADCWLAIRSEFSAWNMGFSKETGKPWLQFVVSSFYYRSVCYHSERINVKWSDNSIWLGPIAESRTGDDERFKDDASIWLWLIEPEA